MNSRTRFVESTEAPSNRPIEVLDVRRLGPPKPLTRTLERLAELPNETILIQRNDRAPQFLYPKLQDRGYAYETISRDGETVTVIWSEG